MHDSPGQIKNDQRRESLVQDILDATNVPPTWRDVFASELRWIIAATETSDGKTRQPPSRKDVTRRLDLLIAGIEELLEDGSEAAFVASAFVYEGGDQAEIVAAGIAGRRELINMLERARRAREATRSSRWVSRRGAPAGTRSAWLDMFLFFFWRSAKHCGIELTAYKDADGTARGSTVDVVRLAAKYWRKDLPSDWTLLRAIKRAKPA